MICQALISAKLESDIITGMREPVKVIQASWLYKLVAWQAIMGMCNGRRTASNGGTFKLAGCGFTDPQLIAKS